MDSQEKSDIVVVGKLKVPLHGPRGGAIPISLNQLKNNAYSKAPAWAIWQRCKKHYMKNIPMYYELGIPRPVEGVKRFIKIERVFGGRGRVMDRDNFVGGMKPLIDALTAHQWIYDDNPKNVRIYYQQIFEKGVNRQYLMVKIAHNPKEEERVRNNSTIW